MRQASSAVLQSCNAASTFILTTKALVFFRSALYLTSTSLNVMQAGILAVGGTQEEIVLENGQPKARLQMKVTLSADQRVYDGETSSKFLEAFCTNMANPVKLLV